MSLGKLPRKTAPPLGVHTVEIHSIPYLEYFHTHTGISSPLAVATLADGSSNVITVDDGTLFAPLDVIQISNGTFEDSHPTIISVLNNDLTLDRRINFAHEVGTTVEKVVIDMNVLGSLIAPVEYVLRPNVGTIVYVTRLLLTMSHTSAGDLGKFGGLAALLNGVTIRLFKDGQYHTLTNWKTNANIKDDMFNVEFDARSGGQGAYGTSGRWTLINVGVAIGLDSSKDDRLEAYIQDDLTLQTHFHIKGQGYIEVAPT